MKIRILFQMFKNHIIFFSVIGFLLFMQIPTYFLSKNLYVVEFSKNNIFDGGYFSSGLYIGIFIVLIVIIIFLILLIWTIFDIIKAIIFYLIKEYEIAKYQLENESEEDEDEN